MRLFPPPFGNNFVEPPRGADLNWGLREGSRAMSSGKRLIYIIEDDPDFGFYLERLLKQAELGHPRLIEDGLGGLKACLEEPPDLVILDLDLPSLRGEEICRLLRYDGPVGAIVRIAKEDVEVCGRTIRPGQRVFAMINAANRDPLQFRNPDSLDLNRGDNTHITFGHGIHYCVGAPLARLEGVLLFEEVLARFPHLEVGSPDLQWRDTLVLRGLRSLPLRLAPG